MQWCRWLLLHLLTLTHTHTLTHSLSLGETPLDKGSDRDKFHSLQNQGPAVDHPPSSSDQVNNASVYILSSIRSLIQHPPVATASGSTVCSLWGTSFIFMYYCADWLPYSSCYCVILMQSSTFYVRWTELQLKFPITHFSINENFEAVIASYYWHHSDIIIHILVFILLLPEEQRAKPGNPLIKWRFSNPTRNIKVSLTALFLSNFLVSLRF